MNKKNVNVYFLNTVTVFIFIFQLHVKLSLKIITSHTTGVFVNIITDIIKKYYFINIFFIRKYIHKPINIKKNKRISITRFYYLKTQR